MRLAILCSIPLVFFSAGAVAESVALEDAAKQFLKDSANTSSAPPEAAQTVDSAASSVEKAKNLKESMERPLGAPKLPGAESSKAVEKPEPAATVSEPAKKTGKAKSTKKPPTGR